MSVLLGMPLLVFAVAAVYLNLWSDDDHIQH